MNRVKIVGAVIAIWLLFLVFGWRVLALTGSAGGGASVEIGLWPAALITLLGMAGGLLVAWLVFPKRRGGQPAKPALSPSDTDISAILEQHFFLALEQAPVGIAMIDAKGQYLWVNRAFCSMLGYEAGDLYGRSYREITHPDDLANDEKILDEALSGHIATSPTEKRYLRRNGSIVWVNRNSIFIAGGEEHGDCVLAMMENITERKTAEDALGESRLRLKDAQRMARLAYWSWDIESDRVTRGAEAIEMLGCGDTGIEPTVEAFYRYVHPDDADGVRAWLQAARDEDRDHLGHNYRIIRGDGSLRHVHGEARFERRPDGTVERIWGIAQDVTERTVTEEKLRKRETQLRNAQRLTHIGNWEWDMGNQRVFRSDEIYRIFGRSRDQMAETVEAFRDCIHPDDRAAHLEWSNKAMTESGRGYSGDYRIVRPDGEIRHVHAEGKIERDESGKPVRVWGTIQDITDRHETEDKLRQAQKMEVVGRLTGGVAHDFNNLLSIVTGNLELVRDAFGLDDNPGQGDKTRGYLEAASRAAWRGADLVQRLLSFSRRQVLQPEAIRVDALIARATTVITRQLGDSITVQHDPTPGLWSIHVDCNQLENCLIDLAHNARDAMPNGGRLTFSSRNDTVNAPREDMEIDPGDYVVIAVSDTGVGIDETQRHLIFEPFFTTKDVGAGSGLGLSMVYGFIKQSGGDIRFDSTPGKGATCSIYLPRSAAGIAP